MKKKILSLILTVSLCMALLICGAAADDYVTAYVSLSIHGTAAMSVDGTPIIGYAVEVPAGGTIEDMFRILHDVCPEGTDGYSTGETRYGFTCPNKLWGVDISNHTVDGDKIDYTIFTMINGSSNYKISSTEVKDGDVISISVFEPLTNNYSGNASFDKGYAEVDVGEVLTLNAVTESFSLSSYCFTGGAAAGLKVTCGGAALGYTDNNGSISLSFDKPGAYYIIAAKSADCGPAMTKVVVGGVETITDTQYKPNVPSYSTDAGIYDAEQKTYTVLRGDTLWGICSEIYGTGMAWRQVWAANTDTITNPDLIIPGQIIIIP